METKLSRYLEIVGERQLEFAERAGVSRSAVSRACSGRNVSSKNINRILTAVQGRPAKGLELGWADLVHQEQAA